MACGVSPVLNKGKQLGSMICSSFGGCPLRVEGEVDGGAAVDGPFGPGPAAVALDDAPDAGQADAGAGELAGAVQPLERLEQLADVGRVEAGPVIAHVTADGRVAGGCGPELDGGAVAAGGELPGVFEQVVQHGPDQGAVRDGPDAFLHGHPNLTAGVAGAEPVADGGDLGAEVDVLEAHLGLGHL